MSRGPGWVMRAALAFVEARERPVDAFDTAAAVYGVARAADGRAYVTRSQTTAVRRALVELVRRGEVRDMGRSWRFGRRHYASPAVATRYEERRRAVFGPERADPRRDRLIGGRLP